MKLTGSFSRLAFYGAVAAGIAISSTAWAAAGSATITKVVGKAEMSTDGTTWTAATVAKALPPGSSIRTPAGGQVDVSLQGNGGTVQLSASTELKFERLSTTSSGAGTVADTGLDLKAGTIIGRVTQLPSGSKYDVKTPTSVIAINTARGPSKYQISANGNSSAIDGQLVVARSGGNPATVNAGQTFNGTGAASGTVTATPPAILLSLPDPTGPDLVSTPTAPTAPTVQFIAPVVSGTTGN